MELGPTEREPIEGVGTYALEIVAALPDVDVIIVPVGAGFGGNRHLPRRQVGQTQVMGVQAKQAPALQRSWQAGHPVSRSLP
jgi:threonine dehydratase